MSTSSSAIRSPVEEGKATSDRIVDRPRLTLEATLGCFPGDSFRKGQRESIEQIYDAFERGYKFVVLEAPTGVGKSFIGMTFARAARECHLLTIQKILQDQYARDFGDEAFVMKGRSAYTCAADPAHTCATGPCRRNKALRQTVVCPYRAALQLANEAKITIHNFDSFYYQARIGSFSFRDLVIVDEAHNIENKFLGFMQFSISNRDDPTFRIPQYTEIQQYDGFLRDHREVVRRNLEVLESREELSEEEQRRADELSDLDSRLQRYIAIRSCGSDIEYVCDYVERDSWQTVTFRPVFVGSFLQSDLFLRGSRFLMMSATILDKSIFCESIGVQEDEVAFIQVPSVFPVKNRPIIRKYAGLMSYKHIDATLPKSLGVVRQILDKFPDRKGIIQTHSEKIAWYIKNNLFDARLTFRRDYASVDEMMRVHTTKAGSFIVASGLREGLDLHGDLSQVQILMKVPYLDLSDKRVVRRKELNTAWYGYQACLHFVQILGRSVRSENDKAVTYIVDEGFELFYRMNRRFIPSYIKEAIRGT